MRRRPVGRRLVKRGEAEIDGDASAFLLLAALSLPAGLFRQHHAPDADSDRRTVGALHSSFQFLWGIHILIDNDLSGQFKGCHPGYVWPGIEISSQGIHNFSWAWFVEGLMIDRILKAPLARRLCVFTLLATAPIVAQQPDSMKSGFTNLPDSAKPRVWWHWMSGNVTEEGITPDLEWMHRVGIGGMQMFDGDLGVAHYMKPVVWMTPEWEAAM
jgi:hypothetical protein